MRHLPSLARRTLAVLSISLLLTPAPRVRAEDKPPAADAAANAAPNTAAKSAIEEIDKAGQELDEVLGVNGVSAFSDATLRKELGPKATPIIRKKIAAFDKLVAAEPRAKDQIASARPQYLSMLYAFGDADAGKELTDLAKGTGEPALQAKMSLIVTDWWLHSGDAAAQQKVADQAVALFKANPSSESIAESLLTISHSGAANSKLRDALEAAIIDNVQGEPKELMTNLVSSLRKMRELEGKPLVVEGTTVEGHPFTSADWKGKVVLVDFWATWCPPCRAELPRLEKVYKQFHDKGLEIVGVSSDDDERMLKGYVSQDKEMPWPQLFDPKTQELHPLAKQYGIAAIPAMFLIDKKGVLRSVDARDDYLSAVPKLLAE